MFIPIQFLNQEQTQVAAASKKDCADATPLPAHGFHSQLGDLGLIGTCYAWKENHTVTVLPS